MAVESTKGDFTYEGWAVVELMGHRRLGGHVTSVTYCGVPMLLVNVPGEGDAVLASQLYSPSALYCLTPCGEAEARAVAAQNKPQPVHPWEMRAAQALPHRDDADDPDDGDDDEDEEGRPMF